MKKRVFLAAAASAWLASAALAPAAAQTWPDRPIKVIVPFAAGNVLDTALRQVGEEMKKTTGQNIVIDNKPGGAGIIAHAAPLQREALGGGGVEERIRRQAPRSGGGDWQSGAAARPRDAQAVAVATP